jgi:hypothetical protein
VETICIKQSFEQMALFSGIVIERYLTDTGTFKTSLFIQHFQNHIHIHFCRAYACHKNGILERGF